MKKIIIILAFVPFMAHGQKSNQKSDTTFVKPAVSDSTIVISLRDLNAFLLLLGQVPHEDYVKYQAILGELWNWKLSQKKP